MHVLIGSDTDQSETMLGSLFVVVPVGSTNRSHYMPQVVLWYGSEDVQSILYRSVVGVVAIGCVLLGYWLAAVPLWRLLLLSERHYPT